MNKGSVLFLAILIGLIQKITYAEQSYSNPVLEKRLQDAMVEKTVINGQEYLNVKFAGSLEPNFQLDCISMKEVSNKFNPPALMLAAKKCVLQNDYEKVWDLINTANGFAYYDLKRLADRSLKGALMVLSYKFSASLTPEQDSKGEAASKIALTDAKKVQEYCAELTRIGAPTYEPQWAIAHGLGSYGNAKREGHYLVDVDPKAIWAEVLNNRCTVKETAQ